MKTYKSKFRNQVKQKINNILNIILQTMLEYLERLRVEDLNNLLEKRKAQREIMKEVQTANKALKEQKLVQKEHERLSELKVMQYLKEKAVSLSAHFRSYT